MSPEYEKKLEERIHRELMGAPGRPAPDALVSSVLAAIQERAARPWWRRPIPQWPRKNQFLFVAAMLAIVAAAMLRLEAVWPADAISDLPNQAAAAINPVRPAWEFLEAVTRAAALVVQSLSQPWLIALGLGALFFYLSCVGMGMAWYRVTFQKGAPALARA